MSEKTKALREEILELVKAEGMDATEEAVYTMTKTGFAIVKIALPKVNPLFGSILVSIITALEPKVYEIIDKLDGKDDPNR